MKHGVVFMFLIFINLGSKSVYGNWCNMQQTPPDHPYQTLLEVLPNTKKLTWQGDMSARLLDSAHGFIDKQIANAAQDRLAKWNYNFNSVSAYEKSIEPNRNHFNTLIGLSKNDNPFGDYNTGWPYSQPVISMKQIKDIGEPYLVAETDKYEVYKVRWPSLNKVYGEGLLIKPKQKIIANIITIPDADQTPEQLMGLSPGILPQAQIARQLAENGYQVLIPVIIDRTQLFKGATKQQSYRERLYRQAYHLGYHIIGFEIQKIKAAIDWFHTTSGSSTAVGIVGYNEGAMLAFYTAAVDTRIKAALVSGYFNSREKTWNEPLYRNIWGQLTEFGDAEIASLIAPRALIVEYSEVPTYSESLIKDDGKPFDINGFPITGYRGEISTAAFSSVSQEVKRYKSMLNSKVQSIQLISNQGKPVPFASKESLDAFIRALGQSQIYPASATVPIDSRKSFKPEVRQLRQAKEIEDFLQWVLRFSDNERNKFYLNQVMPERLTRQWSTNSYHPYSNPDQFIEKNKSYRKYFREEILGSFQKDYLPANAKTRKLYETDRWTGYEVLLDVYPSLYAAGIVLIPKNLKLNEKRPVVVTQHGRSGIPQQLIEGNSYAYNNVAAKLADRGFVVYAPYNPYRGEDSYRWLNRKANTLKKTLFSFIVAQHEQTLNWLASLPFVDKTRIGFYGISYGGETAMRVPAVLEGYCLSICSGDFGDWTRKVVDAYYPGSFINTPEWEMSYYNMGTTFSYAEMAYLIFPRPFMVERGHDDLVQPDEWIGYEYAKIKYVYDQFNKGDKTTIEYFNGGHSMRNIGTFDFLHKHLNWP